MILQLILYTLMIIISFYIFGVLEYYFKMKRDVEVIKLKNKLEEREDDYFHKLISMDEELKEYREKYYNTKGEIESLEDQVYYLDMDIEHYVDRNHELQYRIEELQFEIDNLKNGGY